MTRSCPDCRNPAGSLEHAVACLGRPRCAAPFRGFSCTRKPGHPGQHRQHVTAADDWRD